MAAPPPPFNTDVDFHESRQLELIVTAWLCTGITIFTVTMKLFTKAQIVKIVGWDDFFIFVSMALSVIASALVSYSVTLGFGRHTVAVLAEPDGPQRLVDTAFWQQLGYPFNIGAFSFPNISIAILVVKLLDPHTGRAWALYGLVWLQVALALASVGVIFAQCTPTRKLWDKAAPGTCWDPAIFNDVSYFVSAYTTLTDVVLAVVPIAAFWRLQMPRSTKLAVCLMMGFTLLSAVVTLVKAFYLHLFTDVTDPLWNVVPLVIWGLIEQNVVIVAACIPTLRPFFTKGVLRSRPSGATPRSDSWPGTSKASSRHRWLFSLAGGRGPPRPVATTPEVPLRDMDRQASHHSHSDGDAAFHDDGSQKGIMRTVAVAMEWETELPQSDRTDKSDWIVPLPLAAGTGRGGRDQQRVNETRRQQ